MRKWTTLVDLAGLLMASAANGKTVRLSADTAHIVGLKLMTADAKPTHAEVVALICDSKCERGCIPCTFKANAIVRAYGQGWTKHGNQEGREG